MLSLDLDDNTPAPTDESLMRSRYTAYNLLCEDYVLPSWHISARPALFYLAEDASSQWLGLQIKRHEQQDADHAIVKFFARHKVNGRVFGCMKPVVLFEKIANIVKQTSL